MKLEQQVVSLELAKKLKELGVPQQSLFWWDDHSEIGMGFIVSYDEPDNPVCSAYTVAELGEMLPNETRDGLGFFSGLAINGWSVNGWFCEVKNYRVMPFERLHVELQHDTEANARAAMLIYLIENNLIKL